MKKHLNDRKIAVIVETIDGWSGKLTWGLLLEKIEPKVGRYTRQTLNSHVRIKSAFEERKKALRGARGASIDDKPIELQKALQKIKKLEATNDRLSRENQELLEQFVRWSYNAHCKGVTVDHLNAPLPAIDRERS
ncbi:hypothetical protein [Terasakiella sp.]|uniref:hypothetical protein n=1 Tax=Terasakiella sp. TaxID=2034861 RepID=UPI003AA89BF9